MNKGGILSQYAFDHQYYSCYFGQFKIFISSETKIRSGRPPKTLAISASKVKQLSKEHFYYFTRSYIFMPINNFADVFFIRCFGIEAQQVVVREL